MKCREFIERATDLSLTDPVAVRDEQLAAHLRDCGECASWYEQRETLAAAIAALRNSTAEVEAGPHVEAAVLRAFRRSSGGTVSEQPTRRWFAFSLGSFFAPAGYAAVAAILALALGLGVWFWQRAEHRSQPSAFQHQTEPSSPSQTAQPVQTADSSAKGATEEQQSARSSKSKNGTAPAASSASLAQLAQAQGYIPLMFCDPLSCSGDEQVVRMEIPASAVDSEPQLADVVIGDDGLVRAIRIVQQ